MTNATASYENVFDSLAGSTTPNKKRNFGQSSTTPSSSKQSSSKNRAGDRFIPQRSAMDLDVSHFELTRSADAENVANVNALPSKEEYNRNLAQTLMSGNPSSKVLAFKNKPAPASVHESSLRVLYTANREAGMQPKKYSRHIPQAPERILDAPELLDDYYLNLLDWSSQNILAVALGDSIYLWNATDGSIQQLCQTQGEGSHVTSLAWIPQGNYISVGTSDNKVQIWDVEKLKQVRSMDGHRARVSSMAWNGATLSSAGRDSTIIHHDVRQQQHKIGSLRGHTQEVCGLKWSPSGTQLASGGNDNLLNIWDDRYTREVGQQCDTPLHRLEAHQAAVKALAWCPLQRNLLASGGGTADRHIRFWNSNTGTMINEVDTHSQVCSLQWSQHDKELVSSHGYSHNQLILWKYPSMVKVAELTGHTARVLHMAQSPDGTTICSAAADETLRFWNILSGGENGKKTMKMSNDSVCSGLPSMR